jgi:hypothetical protein
MSDTVSNTKSTPKDKGAYISGEIAHYLKKSSWGQKLWSFSAHGSTIIIVTFSAVAATLSQASITWHSISANGLATVLSLAVAVVSTIQSKLGFERKWVANRLLHNALVRLTIDENMGSDPVELANSLKDALAAHDKAVTTE